MTASTRFGSRLRSGWWPLIAALGLTGVVGSAAGAMWAGIVDRDPVGVGRNILAVVVARWWMAGRWVRFRTPGYVRSGQQGP